MSDNYGIEVLQRHGINKNLGFGGITDSRRNIRADVIINLEDVEYWVSLWEVIGCECGGYDGDLDDLLLGLVKNYMNPDAENNGIFFDKTRQNEIELLNYIMCSSDILEYGSSPRFPWLTTYGEVVFDLYFKQIRPDCLDDDDL